jgi:hypothetical protein
MISPSYSLTATERVLPKLALDFTTAALDPRVTFTRTGNTATVTNSSGVIVGINADLPRFDFDPVTFVCRGLLIEESRTNALLNSLLDGTSLATQSVTVTAAARTLSFYGTGEIVLSGAASATVTGTGAYPTRTTLTFTPSAGTLTLTVTGTVQFAQLELGSFATSFIPTAGSAVTRNDDVATMTGTNFSDWFNATEGTFDVSVSQFLNTGVTTTILEANTPSVTRLGLNRQSGGGASSFITGGPTLVTPNQMGNGSAALAYKANSFGLSTNAGAVASSATGTVPTCTTLMIGSRVGSYLNGVIAKISYYPVRLTNAELQAISKV